MIKIDLASRILRGLCTVLTVIADLMDKMRGEIHDNG